MFQIVENWEKRKIIESMTLESLVERIKNPSNNYVDKISKIRKLPRKSKEYDDIKKTLPCFTTAFNFKGYISNKNIGSPTGYLYLDVDNVENINLDHPSVVFYCKSVSNMGFSIIVGVIGVTSDNVSKVTHSVAQELDIKLDSDAVSKDRLTVISYDKDAYYNPEHTYFLYENGILKNPHFNNKHYINISTDCSGGKIRKDNLQDIISTIDFKGEVLKDFGQEKIGYIRLMTPFKDVEDGNRNSTMNKICYFIRGLNPEVEKNIVLSYMESINVSKFKPPLAVSELQAIADSVFRIENIKLYPNEFRRFIYNPDYELTSTEKRQENIKVICADRVLKTCEKIQNVLDNWDYKLGKVTQKKLAVESHSNIKTIEKHYFKFKEKISDINLNMSK